MDASNIDELRAAQSVLLPLLGLTLDQTAAAVGKSKSWISRARNALLDGKPPPSSHGGRRAAIVRADEEVHLLRQAIRNAHERFDPLMFRQSRVRAALRELLDLRASAPVSDSTISEFLSRTVPKLMPQLQGIQFRDVSRALDSYWSAEYRLSTAIDRLKQP